MTTHDSAADRRQFLAALAVAAATPSAAFGKTANHAAVRVLVDHYVSTKQVPNLVVAVGRRDGPPDFISAGTLELGAGPTAGPDTLYRIYSMSKLIAGCAIMMLIEDGKLTLDTPLSSILPAFANMTVLTDPENSVATRPAVKQITIRHLVTHTSGLSYSTMSPPPLAKLYFDKGIDPGRTSQVTIGHRPMGLAAFSDAAASLPLLFEPGTKWNYSIGLDIAGSVVEKLTGLAFEDFLAQRIFAPLGMVDTFFIVPAAKLGRFVANYAFTPTGIELIETAQNSIFAQKPEAPSGGGGLVSSARDYSKFMAMLLGEGQAGKTRILKTETARVMMSNIMEPGVIAETSSGPTGFGAGGRSVVTATPGGEAVGTYGWSGAANSHAFVDRASGVYVVLMTQVMRWTNSTLLPDLDKALYADLAAK